MSAAKHTPGPWVWDEVDPEWLVSVRNGKDLADQAVVLSIRGENIKINNPADKRLIAAAPDLLKALEGAIRIKELWMPYEYSEKYQHEIHALASMRRNFESAIAKATGKEAS